MVLFDCHRGTALLVCGGSDNVWELCQYSLTADLTIISAEVHNLPLLPGVYTITRSYTVVFWENRVAFFFLLKTQILA